MTLALFLSALLLFVGLVISQEIFHRYPRFSLGFFLTASIILFPCWVLLIGVEDWFAWLKVFSIASGIIVLSVLRTTRLGSNATLIRLTVYAFLVVNILEAVVRDAVAGSSAHYFSALAGLLLIATLEKLRTVHIDTTGKQKDLCWSGMTLSWIIGYTLWNWGFVYLNFGFQSSILHIAVLASALLTACVDKQRWLQARIFTLGTFFIIFHSSPHLTSRLLVGGQNQQLSLIVSLVALGFMIVYMIVFIRKKLFMRV
ncbi:MAG: DUF5692 family protein [Patescibacteria group bacterium]